MSLKTKLLGIANLVVEEAAKNAEFRSRLEAVLDGGKPPAHRKESRATSRNSNWTPDDIKDQEQRRGGRRSPAVLDPIELASHGEAALRTKLAELDVELLHDVVAQYGMDPGKLVMKWRDRDRIIDRIVEVAVARATKGDAFRKE